MVPETEKTNATIYTYIATSLSCSGKFGSGEEYLNLIKEKTANYMYNSITTTPEHI